MPQAVLGEGVEWQASGKGSSMRSARVHAAVFTRCVLRENFCGASMAWRDSTQASSPPAERRSGVRVWRCRRKQNPNDARPAEMSAATRQQAAYQYAKKLAGGNVAEPTL